MRLYVAKSNLAGWMDDKVSKSGHSQISATIQFPTKYQTLLLRERE